MQFHVLGVSLFVVLYAAVFIFAACLLSYIGYHGQT
jgi:hypothetical protein